MRLKRAMALFVAGLLTMPAFADDATPPLPLPRPDIDAQPQPPAATPGQESDRQRLIRVGLPGDDGDALMPPTDAPDIMAKLGKAPRPVTLVAEITEKGAQITQGLVWRIYGGEPDKTGNLPLVTKSSAAAPTVNLPPGDYVVHVAYGEAQTSDTLNVRGSPQQKTMILDVGALRLNAAITGDIQIPVGQLHFDVFTPGATGNDRTLVAAKVGAGDILTLSAGIYHVVSYFGDVNAVERADLRVQPGRLTDATLYQKAAQVALKLVSQPGGEAIADVDWTIRNKDGQQIYAQSGAFPSCVLEEGSYTVTAKRADRTYTQQFSVAAGKPDNIEVLTSGG